MKQWKSVVNKRLYVTSKKIQESSKHPLINRLEDTTYF